MARYSPEQLGFLDEVSKDERTLTRSRGRSRKGTRAVKKGVLFVDDVSLLKVVTIDGMISNTVIEGSMTCAQFLQYLEFTVVGFPTYSCQLQLQRLTYGAKMRHVYRSLVISVFSSWIMLASTMEIKSSSWLIDFVCIPALAA